MHPAIVEGLVNVMAAPWELHHLEYLCLDKDPDLVSKLLGYNSIAIVEKKPVFLYNPITFPK